MGRNRKLSKDELLRKAMHVFRQHGFAGTSAEILVRETGMSRHSLYADYKSKQELFAAALELYNEEIIEARFGPLEQEAAQLESIVELFEFYGGEGAQVALGKGCLLCNSVVEFGAEDPTDQDSFQRYFVRINGAFKNVLLHSKDKISAGTDIDQEADFLTSSVLGIFVMIRAKAPQNIIHGSTKFIIEHLNKMIT